MLELSGAVPTESLVTSRLSKVEGIEVGKGSRGATDVIKSERKLAAHGL